MFEPSGVSIEPGRRNASGARRAPRSQLRARGSDHWPRPKAALVVDDSGFVWSMNCESCEEPKNSRTAAAAGSVDQVLRHDGVDLDRRHPLLDGALHAKENLNDAGSP